MRWQWKCLIDTAKALLPYEHQLRKAKYQLFSYREEAGRDSWTIQEGLEQIDWIRSVRPLESLSVLEVGSGWQPIIPVLFSLAGAGRVLMTDMVRLCTPASLQAALRSLMKHKSLIVERLRVSENTFDLSTSWDPSLDVDQALGRLRLKYLAPCDCQHLDLPSESLDVIVSRAVLEHIPPPVIDNIFLE